MTTQNENQPAYPQAFPVADLQTGIAQQGLTKLELVAAMAMQGLCANQATLDGEFKESDASLAEVSVGIARALLAACTEQECCEWCASGLYPNMMVSGCHGVVEPRTKGNFCPHCGRKIKEIK